MTFIQTTRRRMLLGLAAASTAAATGANAAGQSPAVEAPELLSMGDSLSDTLTTYKEAAACVTRIAEEWGPQWPIPDDRVFSYVDGSKTHRDILGRGIETLWAKKTGVMRVQHLGTPESFQREAEREWARYERKMRTKSQRGSVLHKNWAEKATAAIEPAQEYWSEVDRITQASGIEGAKKAKTEARDILKDLVDSIMLFREKSITGLIIKAQAMQAWGEVDDFFVILNPKATAWADAMAETILRQTKFA